jgi:hypothetical protein
VRSGSCGLVDAHPPHLPSSSRRHPTDHSLHRCSLPNLNSVNYGLGWACGPALLRGPALRRYSDLSTRLASSGHGDRLRARPAVRRLRHAGQPKRRADGRAGRGARAGWPGSGYFQDHPYQPAFPGHLDPAQLWLLFVAPLTRLEILGTMPVTSAQPGAVPFRVPGANRQGKRRVPGHVPGPGMVPVSSASPRQHKATAMATTSSLGT